MKKFCLCVILVMVLCPIVSMGAVAAEAEQAAQAAAIEQMVNEAADLLQQKGEDALAAIADKNGKFAQGDSYVFITSGETGADLINPAFPNLEGMPAKDYTSKEQEEAQAAIVNAVKDSDTAWVEYMWPKPGEAELSRKKAFLRKVNIGDKVRIVGAGYYIK